MYRRTKDFVLAVRWLRLAAVFPVLAGLAAGSVGFPTAPVLSGGAFPCQGHGCGCGSLEQCWFNCCCLTPAQRLAWAKREGVAPPPGLAELAAAEPAPVAAKPRAACCAGHGAKSCCAPKATCCSLKGKRPAVSKTSVPAERDPVAVLAVLRCKGLAPTWVAGGEPLVPPEPPVELVLSPPAPDDVTVAALAGRPAAPPESPPG